MTQLSECPKQPNPEPGANDPAKQGWRDCLCCGPDDSDEDLQNQQRQRMELTSPQRAAELFSQNLLSQRDGLEAVSTPLHSPRVVTKPVVQYSSTEEAKKVVDLGPPSPPKIVDLDAHLGKDQQILDAHLLRLDGEAGLDANANGDKIPIEEPTSNGHKVPIEESKMSPKVSPQVMPPREDAEEMTLRMCSAAMLMEHLQGKSHPNVPRFRSFDEVNDARDLIREMSRADSCDSESRDVVRCDEEDEQFLNDRPLTARVAENVNFIVNLDDWVVKTPHIPGSRDEKVLADVGVEQEWQPSKNAIRRLVGSLMSSTGPMCPTIIGRKVEATRCLHSLACDKDNLEFMVKIGVIPVLVDLLRNSREFEAQEEAARTLRRIAWQNSDYKAIISASGAIAPLTCLLAPESTCPLREQACALLGSLAIGNRTTKGLISEVGAIPLIAKLIEDYDKEESIVEQAVRTLWHLSVNHAGNKKAIADCDAIPALVHLMHYGNEDVRRQAIGVLGSLSMGNAENKAIMRRAAAWIGCDLEDAGLHQHAEPVYLNIYDIGNDESVKYFNGFLRPVGSGAFHAGVEVYGEEWSYGSRSGQISGVYSYQPRECIAHTYRETVDMGFTSLSHTEVWALLARLSDEWPGVNYDFVSNNCCHFSDALCRNLGVDATPQWVTNLADTGALFINGYRSVISSVESAANFVGAGAVVDKAMEHLSGTMCDIDVPTPRQSARDVPAQSGSPLEPTDESRLCEVALECTCSTYGNIEKLKPVDRCISLPVPPEGKSWHLGMGHQPVWFCNLLPDEEQRRALILENHIMISWLSPWLYLTKVTSRPVLVDGVPAPMPPKAMRLSTEAVIGLCEPDSEVLAPFLIFKIALRPKGASEAKPLSLKAVHLPRQATKQPIWPGEDSGSSSSPWMGDSGAAPPPPPPWPGGGDADTAYSDSFELSFEQSPPRKMSASAARPTLRI